MRNIDRSRFVRYVTTHGDHKESPLDGIRILDLTRVGMIKVYFF